MLKTFLSFSGFAVSTLIGATLLVASAEARDCRASSIDPMAWSQSFGVSTCRAKGPRYHINDFAGEAARGYMQASSNDPMVWSDDQWRSDLMGGYADDPHSGYDNRFERSRHVERRIERHMRVIVTSDEDVVAIDKRKGPRMISLDGKIRSYGDTDITRGSRSSCQGILVIRYGQGSRCLNRKPVPVEPHGGPKMIPKMG